MFTLLQQSFGGEKGGGGQFVSWSDCPTRISVYGEGGWLE